jgi:hypothetical protein
MKLSLLHATWATHEAFCRLGIPTKDIFVIPFGGLKKDRVLVQARQGVKEFNFDVGGRHGQSVEAFAAEWTSFLMGLEIKPEEELQTIWDAWLEQVNTAVFVAAMMQKGFRLKSGVSALN